MKKLFVILLISFCAQVNLVSQNDIVQEPLVYDVLYLQHGSKLMGKILEWDPDGNLKFKLASGAIVEFNKDQIRKIEQEFVSLKSAGYRKVKVHNFKSNGLYGNINMHLNSGYTGGIGLSGSIGHRWNRLYSIGFLTGIELTDSDRNLYTIPFSIEARGFLLDGKISPYYAFQLGYGLNFLTESFNLESSTKGGLRIKPEIGVRFGGNKAHFYCGIGFKWQKSSFEFTSAWNPEFRAVEKLTYRRLELIAGYLF